MQQFTVFVLVICASICPLLAQQSSLYPADRMEATQGWMFGGMLTMALGQGSSGISRPIMSATAMANAVVRNSAMLTVHTCYMLTLQHASGTTGDVDYTAQAIRLQIGQIHELKLSQTLGLNLLWAVGFGIPLSSSISTGTITSEKSTVGYALTLETGVNIVINGVQVRPQIGAVVDTSTFQMYYTSNKASYSASVASVYPLISCMVVL